MLKSFLYSLVNVKCKRKGIWRVLINLPIPARWSVRPIFLLLRFFVKTSKFISLVASLFVYKIRFCTNTKYLRKARVYAHNDNRFVKSTRVLLSPSNQRRNESLTFNPALRKGHQILPKSISVPL